MLLISTPFLMNAASWVRQRLPDPDWHLIHLGHLALATDLPEHEATLRSKLRQHGLAEEGGR